MRPWQLLLIFFLPSVANGEMIDGGVWLWFSAILQSEKIACSEAFSFHVIRDQKRAQEKVCHRDEVKEAQRCSAAALLSKQRVRTVKASEARSLCIRSRSLLRSSVQRGRHLASDVVFHNTVRSTNTPWDRSNGVYRVRISSRRVLDPRPFASISVVWCFDAHAHQQQAATKTMKGFSSCSAVMPLISLLLSSAPRAAWAQRTRQSYLCILDDNPIETLVYDKDTEMYAVQPRDVNNRTDDDDRTDDDASRHRSLTAEQSALLFGLNDYTENIEDAVAATTRARASFSADDDSHSKGVARHRILIKEDNETIEMRECDCASPDRFPELRFFCPLNKSFCWVPRTSSKAPVCLNIEQKQQRAKDVWPFCLGLFALTSVCLLCTPNGSEALRFLCSLLLPCGWTNKLYARYLLRRDPPRAHAMIRSWVERRSGLLEQRYHEVVVEAEAQQGAVAAAEAQNPANNSLSNNTGGNNSNNTTLVHRQRSGRSSTSRQNIGSRQNSSASVILDDVEEALVQESHIQHEQNRTSLRLKTRKFKETKGEDETTCNGLLSEEEVFDDLKNSTSCAICFGPIERGDVVGDIPCQHILHKECLKVWLKRRNVCPLCLRADIATLVVPEQQEGQHQRRVQMSALSDLYRSGVLAEPIMESEEEV